MKADSDVTYEFGPFLLVTEEQTLLRDGKPLPLTPKAYETLLALVQNAGHVLDKNRLLETIWHGTFVTEATLAQNVSTLRKVLGRSQSGGHYIETVPKRGYRFAADVWTRRNGGGGHDNGASAGYAADAGATPQEADLTRARVFNSLAILPFVNKDGDPNVEYLSDGITESIINIMSQLGTLKVTAPSIIFRHRDESLTPQEVGRRLGVEAVLSGRVIRLNGRLVIRTELVDVLNGWQLWGEQYDRAFSSILELQVEVAGRIAEQLQLRLLSGGRGHRFKDFTDNPEAYRLYMQGRHHWNQHTKEGYGQALGYFEQAIEVEPRFALAYSGLADTYVMRDFYGLLPPWEMIPKAMAAAMKALEIDDQLSEAYSSLAFVNLLYQYDWASAEKGLHRAIKLNMRNAIAHQRYAHYLLARGLFGQALTESRLALELEPFDLSCNLQLGWYYIYARQYRPAIEQLQKTIGLNSVFWPAHVLLGIAYEHNRMFPEAISALQKAQLLELSPFVTAVIGHTHAAAGERVAALKALDELNERAAHHYVQPYFMALIYAGLGDNDVAFAYLEDAYEARNHWLGWIKVDPALDNLRSDVRFKRLVGRLGLAP